MTINEDYPIKLHIYDIKREKITLKRTMANSQIQNIIMIMFMIISIFMFSFAHANNNAPPETTDSAISVALCVAKCGLECADELGNKIQYAACVAECSMKCHKRFSIATYDCTNSCAYSKFNNNIGMFILPPSIIFSQYMSNWDKYTFTHAK
jgi:hypothetical protein